MEFFIRSQRNTSKVNTMLWEGQLLYYMSTIQLLLTSWSLFIRHKISVNILFAVDKYWAARTPTAFFLDLTF